MIRAVLIALVFLALTLVLLPLQLIGAARRATAPRAGLSGMCAIVHRALRL